jgi:hypothetical protein
MILRKEELVIGMLDSPEVDELPSNRDRFSIDYDLVG